MTDELSFPSDGFEAYQRTRSERAAWLEEVAGPLLDSASQLVARGHAEASDGGMTVRLRVESLMWTDDLSFEEHGEVLARRCVRAGWNHAVVARGTGDFPRLTLWALREPVWVETVDGVRFVPGVERGTSSQAAAAQIAERGAWREREDGGSEYVPPRQIARVVIERSRRA